jgi:hypothetical protein
VATIIISKACATVWVRLMPEDVQEGSGVELEQSNAGLAPPRFLSLSLRQIEVCFWDDERKRLLAYDSAFEEDPGALHSMELFSFTCDDLALKATRSSPQAGTVFYSAKLSASTLQCDSFHPGCEQPVILTTAARAGPPGVPAEMPLCIDFEVSYASIVFILCCSWWCRSFLISLVHACTPYYLLLWSFFTGALYRWTQLCAIIPQHLGPKSCNSAANYLSGRRRYTLAACNALEAAIFWTRTPRGDRINAADQWAFYRRKAAGRLGAASCAFWCRLCIL